MKWVMDMALLGHRSLRISVLVLNTRDEGEKRKLTGLHGVKGNE
jgi:hypothetical protein